MKPWVWRFAASDAPMPGVAQAVMPLESDLVAVVLEATFVTNAGVSASDLRAFLDSPAGLEQLMDDGAVFEVKQRQVLWVPCGALAVYVYMPEGKEAEAALPTTSYLSWTAFLLRRRRRSPTTLGRRSAP